MTIVRNAFTDAVTVTVGGLPEHVTASQLTITGDSGMLTINVEADAAQGDTALTVTAKGGTRSHNAALSLLAMGPPGTLDTSFATGGSLMAPPTGRASAIVIQPDGKIVVAGYTADTAPKLLVARFLPTGALDAGFAGGVVTLDSTVSDFGNAVALQPDGKIVVAGDTTPTDNNGRRGLVVRFNSDGTPDLGFGTRGRFEHSLGPTDNNFTRLRGVVVQPDGGIVVAGIASVSGGDFDAVLARLAPGGGLDNSFGTGDGRIRISLGPGVDGLSSVVLQPDGRIVGLGGTTLASGSAIAAFVRVTSAGLPDNTFDGDGKLTIDTWEIGNDTADYEWQLSVALQPDGKIIGGGSSPSANPSATMVRLNGNDGSRDAGFGTNGVKVVSLTPGHFDRVNGVALQPDGKLLLSGSVPVAASSSNFDSVVARFSSGGVFDLGFGTGGVATRELGDDAASIDQPRAMALDADGRIVVAGLFVTGAGPQKLLLARFWP